MNTRIVPEPFTVVSFSVCLRRLCLTDQLQAIRLDETRRRTLRLGSVGDSLGVQPSQALFPAGSAGGKALKESRGASGGSDEPLQVLESQLVEQQLAQGITPLALALPADRCNSLLRVGSISGSPS